MSVHIGEVRAEVVPPPGGPAGHPVGPVARDDTAEVAAQARCRSDWLATRTRAEGFDD